MLVQRLGEESLCCCSKTCGIAQLLCFQQLGLSVPRKWILKGEAPSYETAWILAASGIMDLQFEWKELLPVLIQFLCPCGTTSGWSDWVEQEVADEGFCQILKNAKIFEAVVVSRGWNMYRDMRALRFLAYRWNPDTCTFFFPWGESTVTLEDVERICLLPSTGDVNPLELDRKSVV